MQLALVTQTLLFSNGKSNTSQPLRSTVVPSGVSGQLSSAFRIPSPSISSSQTSPTPSPSESTESQLR